MLKIRLRRMGKTHQPFFRVVVSDSRRAPTASAIEELGFYDPGKEPSIVSLDLDRIQHWTSHGAQLSAAVRKLVRKGPNAEAKPEAPAKAAKAEPETETAKAEPEAEAAKAEAEPEADTAKAEAEGEAEATEAEPEAKDSKAKGTDSA